MASDLSHNPFGALAALRDTLPESPAGADPDTSSPAPPSSEPASAGAPLLTVVYERKGRGGKEATIIICPPAMSADDALDLAAKLKRTLGTGGSCRGGEILLQGDRRKSLRPLLEKLGFRVKL